jgi:rhomboid protease GluP
MISSESEFVWKQIIYILTLPFLIFQVLLGKKDAGELFQPLADFFEFIFQAKVTLFLIVSNVVVYLFEIFYFTEEQLLTLAFQPEHLFQFQPLPIVASWFLHASLLHLAGNMLFLFIFGRVTENRLGSGKMVLIYFGSAIISTTVAALFGQGGIGASGAIAGLVAAAILIKPFYLTYLIIGIPLPIIAVGWMAIFADITGILVPQDDNIGHFAHLGGYLAITLLVFFLNKEERDDMKKGLFLNIIFVAVVLSLFYFFGIPI